MTRKRQRRWSLSQRETIVRLNQGVINDSDDSDDWWLNDHEVSCMETAEIGLFWWLQFVISCKFASCSKVDTSIKKLNSHLVHWMYECREVNLAILKSWG